MHEALTDAVLFAHALSTVFMTGLIWFVQVVHYPLFASVPKEAFPAYEARHQRRTTLVVGPAMLIELLTAAVLVLTVRPSTSILPAVGLGMLIAIWVSTALVQMPLHRDLALCWNGRMLRRLVASNWIRTALWSGRSVIALLLLVNSTS